MTTTKNTTEQQNAVYANIGRQRGLAFSLLERAEIQEPTFTTLAHNMRKEARERLHWAGEAQGYANMNDRHGW